MTANAVAAATTTATATATHLSDAWRTDVTALVVQTHPYGGRILLLPGDGRWQLPGIVLDDEFWFPDVESLLEKLKEQVNIDTIVVRALSYEGDRASHRIEATILFEPRSAVADVSGGAWLALADVASLEGLTSQTSEAVELLRNTAKADRTVRRPWSEPGWFADATFWMDARLRDLGIERTGPTVQVRTWGLSTVLRVPTTTGNVYFKATAYSGPNTRSSDVSSPGFLFAHEPLLLTALAQRLPKHVLHPLAIDRERVWMLLPDAGDDLADSTDLATWEMALRLHARHQRSYAGRADDLFAAGCLDRRLNRLSAQLDWLAGDQTALAFVDEADAARFRAAVPRLHAMSKELAGLGVPETLVHGDFHAGNLAVRDGRPIYFDWTDGCVTHPFFDLPTFLEESSFLDANPGARDHLRDAYVAEWADVAPIDHLRRALALAEPLGALHQIVSYRSMLDHLEGPTRASMSGGGAFWLRTLLKQLEDAAPV